MTPEQFARVEAITQRIHEKRHRDWNCADMHGVVHSQHMAAFRELARQIVEREKPFRKEQDRGVE